jgi:hypothetical protein
VRDYLDSTIKNMDVLSAQCAGLKSYEPFLVNMAHHRQICDYVLKDFNQVTPNKIKITKVGQIGHTMKCFYQLYKNTQFHETLQYTFGLNGYLDNLNGMRKNISLKHMNTCQFKQNKATKFTNAYFPSLVISTFPIHRREIVYFRRRRRGVKIF